MEAIIPHLEGQEGQVQRGGQGDVLTVSPCLERHHPATFSPVPLQQGPQGESFFTLEKPQELIKDDAWPGISE